MFDSDRKFSLERAVTLVSSQAAKQSTESRQRDVFDSHCHRTFSLAFYMTGNEIEAEKIVTRTFVRAFEQAEQPEAATVDLALVSELRQRFPLQQQEAPAVAATEDSLDRHNIRRTELEEALQTLPANERLLFLLRDVEGYQVEAIAQLLEMSLADVQRCLFSARIRLRQAIASSHNLDRPETEAA